MLPCNWVVSPGQEHVGEPEHGFVVTLVEVQGRNILHRFTLQDNPINMKICYEALILKMP
jgi:hypothetical protein